MKKHEIGMSLVEILIVVAVFAVLGVLTAQSVMITLRGSRKSEAQIKVRENVNYAFSIIERQLRSADEITACPNPNPLTISYKTLEGQISTFTCTVGASGYIASGSGRLTSTDVAVDRCTISCQKGNENLPAKVSVAVTAHETNTSGIETGVVSMQTEIVTRNY